MARYGKLKINETLMLLKPDITIGDNGNWFIDGEDTGKPSGGGGGGGDKLYRHVVLVQLSKSGTAYNMQFYIPFSRTTLSHGSTFDDLFAIFDGLVCACNAQYNGKLYYLSASVKGMKMFEITAYDGSGKYTFQSSDTTINAISPTTYEI